MKKKSNRLLAVLLLAIMSLTTLPALAEVPVEYQHSTLERQVYLPNGAGPFQYYAQNDPIWDRAVYEAYGSASYRPFGDGGCNPTSLAMVVASLVPTERLNLLGQNTAGNRTFTLCSCSVNSYYCHLHRKDASHESATLVSGEDFRTVLPLAIADFATGNNPSRSLYRIAGRGSGGNGGTSKSLFQPIANVFGLSYSITENFDQVLSTLDRGGMAIALCSGGGQIFSGGNGHYVVLCSYDAEYVYILDPYIRDQYKRDRNGIIEPVDVGVKKVKRRNISSAGFGNFALFEAASETYYASIPLITNPYIVDATASTALEGSLTASAGN